MIAALSPLLSWLVVGFIAGFAITVYLLASERLDRRMVEVLPQVNVRPEDAPPSADFPPVDPTPWVRVLPTVYDWQAREDFHDPIRDHEWCDDCNARLRRAFNRLGDLDLGPRDADELMAAIRRELKS